MPRGLLLRHNPMKKERTAFAVRSFLFRENPRFTTGGECAILYETAGGPRRVRDGGE